MYYRQRDNQKSRVYGWEESVERLDCDMCNTGILTLPQAKAYSKKIWRRFAWKTLVADIPIIKIKNGKRGGGSWWPDNTIRLTPRDRTEWLVAHEVTHGLVNYARARNSRLAGHGPEFVRTLIAVVSKYQGYNEGMLVANAKAAGIKVASKAAVNRLGVRI